MSAVQDVTALVPMRHVSERVPGKNYRPVLGIPLYRYVVETLSACRRINRIVIDTDSPTIAADAADAFPDVTVIERPEHLREGTTSMNAVLSSTLSRVEGDVFLQTHSTNPLLRRETIDRAIAAFLDDSGHDSLFSVTPLQARLWDRFGEPMNHDPGDLMRTQDLAPIFVENSCLYIFRRETFVAGGNRLGQTPLMFEIPASEAWDIDDEDDLAIAECLLRGRGDG